MAKQEVGLKIDVDVSSVGNMKQQLRAATNELVAMNEKFGSSSKEATQAAQRVAKLKDAIGDAKALADTFNPDKKFVALGGAVQGAVAGFSALQGAMGLFADKNKEVEQLLLKVQSAMALQQGLSGIAGSIDSFKLLAGTIKAQVVAAFTTLRGAMMATGIGLITSAVAFLVTNFDAVKNKLGELFPALKGAGDLMDRLKQIAMGVGNALLQFLAAPISAIVKAVQGDFKGAFEALKNGVAFTKNFRAGEQKEIKDQADEREKLRQEELKKEQEANKKKLEEQKRAAAERLRKLQEQQEKERQLREAADKVLREVELKGLTERQRQEATLLDEFKKNKATLIAAGVTNFLDLETQYQRDLTAIRVKFETEEAERVKKLQEEKLAKDKARQEADINNKLSEFARIKNVTSDFNKAQVDAEIALQDAKFEAASAGLNALATLAQGNEKIANIFFAIDKALAIGKIIVDAQREISANMLYGASHPMNAIVPGSGAALGAKLSLITKIRAAASIATIVATTIAKFKSGGGASVPNPSGGGGGGINTTAPLAPQLTPQVTATAVNTAAVNQMGNQATRAYVLNSDIQNNDQRNAYIDRNASIG
jgi:hypothetical protein